MDIKKKIKEIRFKIFIYLLKSCFKPELKDTIMRKYYVSYVIVNPNQGMPIPGDTFVDIDGKITESSIKNIKKSILDNYLKYNAPQIPGMQSNVHVVLNCINDITKEENDNAAKALNNKSENNKTIDNKEKEYFLPGAIEVINGKKYIGGKEVVE